MVVNRAKKRGTSKSIGDSGVFTENRKKRGSISTQDGTQKTEMARLFRALVSKEIYYV